MWEWLFQLHEVTIEPILDSGSHDRGRQKLQIPKVVKIAYFLLNHICLPFLCLRGDLFAYSLVTVLIGVGKQGQFADEDHHQYNFVHGLLSISI